MNKSELLIPDFDKPFVHKASEKPYEVDDIKVIIAKDRIRADKREREKYIEMQRKTPFRMYGKDLNI